MSVGLFNDMLAAQGGFGQQLTWRPSTLCPCRDENSGGALPGCFQCHGAGVLYAPPQTAWAGLTGMRVAKEWAAFGQWESGDVVVTVPQDSPLYAAGENDRVLMVQSTEPFRVILTASGADRLRFSATELDRVFWLTPDTTVLVEGAIPDVAPDGSLSWADGTGAPPLGTQYSVTGRRNQEYYVFKDLPQDRAHFGGLPLPRRVVLRRFDLMARGLGQGLT